MDNQIVCGSIDCTRYQFWGIFIFIIDAHYCLEFLDYSYIKGLCLTSTTKTISILNIVDIFLYILLLD